MKKVDSVLENLPREFRKECEAIRKEGITDKTDRIKHKYRIGLLVEKAEILQKGLPMYKDIMVRLRQYLRIRGQRHLQRCRLLTQIFTEKEIEYLSKPSDTSFCLGWSHFEYVLLDYLTKDEMIRYLEYARAREISGISLYRKITKDYNRPKDPQGRTIIKTRDQLNKTINGYLSYFGTKDALLEGVDSTIFQSWMDSLKEEDKVSFIEQLDKHLVSCITLKSKLQAK